MVSKQFVSGLVLSVLFLLPAYGFELDLGENVEGRLDSTFSTGMSVRVGERDKSLVGFANDGTAYSVNSDDGNLNYSPGDIFSLNNKITSDLDIRRKNVNVFIRGSFFYDHAVMFMGTERTPLSDAAKDRRLGWDARLLDAFISADFSMGSSAMRIRAGNIVLNWGESTFIQNGINTINPVDVSKLRVAGSELREALTPIPMLNVNFRVNENLSLEAFYQFHWMKTQIDPAGSYFSTNDFASPGGEYVMLGFGSPGISDNPPVDGAIPVFGSRVPRGSDRTPSNTAQFGFALRYFSPSFNSTEFGLYYTQLHSRVPLISLKTGTLAGVAAGNYAATAEYFNEYPKDLKTIGASFNTMLDFVGVALQGEFSYRFDQPIQIDDVELLFAGLSPVEQAIIAQTAAQNPGVPMDQIIAGVRAQGVPAYSNNQLGPLGFEEGLRGYNKKDVMQGQFTLTKLFGPTLGASELAFVTEFGGTFVRRMEGKSKLRYEGPGTFRAGDAEVMGTINSAALGFSEPIGVEDGGFADRFSWGYRALVRATYSNAIGAVALLPGIGFSHDVNGTTPQPIGNFVQGRMTLSPSLGFSYLENLRGSIDYTAFFGGGRYNLLRDRDFVSANVSYSF